MEKEKRGKGYSTVLLWKLNTKALSSSTELHKTYQSTSELSEQSTAADFPCSSRDLKSRSKLRLYLISLITHLLPQGSVSKHHYELAASTTTPSFLPLASVYQLLSLSFKQIVSESVLNGNSISAWVHLQYWHYLLLNPTQKHYIHAHPPTTLIPFSTACMLQEGWGQGSFTACPRFSNTWQEGKGWSTFQVVISASSSSGMFPFKPIWLALSKVLHAAHFY